MVDGHRKDVWEPFASLMTVIANANRSSDSTPAQFQDFYPFYVPVKNTASTDLDAAAMAWDAGCKDL